MISGFYNKEYSLLSRVTNNDSSRPTEEWKLEKNIKGRIEYKSGGPAIENDGQIMSKSFVLFTAVTDIDESWRLIDGVDVYEIMISSEPINRGRGAHLEIILLKMPSGTYTDMVFNSGD